MEPTGVGDLLKDPSDLQKELLVKITPSLTSCGPQLSSCWVKQEMVGAVQRSCALVICTLIDLSTEVLPQGSVQLKCSLEARWFCNGAIIPQRLDSIFTACLLGTDWASRDLSLDYAVSTESSMPQFTLSRRRGIVSLGITNSNRSLLSSERRRITRVIVSMELVSDRPTEGESIPDALITREELHNLFGREHMTRHSLRSDVPLAISELYASRDTRAQTSMEKDVLPLISQTMNTLIAVDRGMNSSLSSLSSVEPVDGEEPRRQG